MTQPAQQPPPAQQQQPDTATMALLVAAQDQTRQQITGQLTAYVTAAAAGFTAWYSMEAVTAWATAVAGNVQHFLSALAGMTDAYMSMLITEVVGHWVRPVGSIPVDALRAGITHAGAYGRVANAYRFQQSRLDQAALQLLTAPAAPAAPSGLLVPPPADPGLPAPPLLQTPVEAAVERATQVVNLDTQLTVQKQSQATMRAAQDDDLIVGWRRVLHPELSKGGSCGLCIAASTRIYKVEHLMPIHHDCHCLPMPVTLHHDPGSLINDHDLGQFYADAGGTDMAALKRTRYQVNEHGELGPVLAPAGSRVRGPKTAAKQTDPPPPRPPTQSHKDAKVRDLRDSLARSLARLDGLAKDDPATYGEWRDTLAQRVADLDRELIGV